MSAYQIPFIDDAVYVPDGQMPSPVRLVLFESVFTGFRC